MLVPQFLAGRAPSSSSGLTLNVTSLGSGASTQAERPRTPPTPRCHFLRSACLQRTPHFPYLPLAASTPRTETSLVRRSGRECSRNSGDEEWSRTKEEVGEGTEQKAPVSLLSGMMLCYCCLPHTSHTAPRGGSGFSLAPPRMPLAPAPSLFLLGSLRAHSRNWSLDFSLVLDCKCGCVW